MVVRLQNHSAHKEPESDSATCSGGSGNSHACCHFADQLAAGSTIAINLQHCTLSEFADTIKIWHSTLQDTPNARPGIPCKVDGGTVCHSCAVALHMEPFAVLATPVHELYGQKECGEGCWEMEVYDQRVHGIYLTIRLDELT